MPESPLPVGAACIPDGSRLYLKSIGIDVADARMELRRKPARLPSQISASQIPSQISASQACRGTESQERRADDSGKKKGASTHAEGTVTSDRPEAPASTKKGKGEAKSDQPAASNTKPNAAVLAASALGHRFSCMSYNVLLPNNQDGWWIYKYYRNPGEFAEWAGRQAMLKQQLLGSNVDFVCLQEVSDVSWAEDWLFMGQAGYEALMHDKKGRMRPATFWRRDTWELISAQHKDRTLVTAMCLRATGTVLFVVNGHLSAGPQADRRLRQTSEALDTVAKEAKKLGLQVPGVPVVFCGDCNSQGRTGVDELLTAGKVEPDFRESGDPTERGQQGKAVTTKTKSQALGFFADASVAFFGEQDVPSTMILANIDSKMLFDDGTMTPACSEALQAAFASCCSPGSEVMTKADCERWLLAVNRELGRGSEYRAMLAAFEKSGVERLNLDEFVAIYAGELAEGKFWGVEHDLRALGGQGLTVPSEGPCQLRFDHVYFTTSSLKLCDVQDPLPKERRSSVFADPWDVLPNSWHPSDHLPVVATFEFS